MFDNLVSATLQQLHAVPSRRLVDDVLCDRVRLGSQDARAIEDERQLVINDSLMKRRSSEVAEVPAAG